MKTLNLFAAAVLFIPGVIAGYLFEAAKAGIDTGREFWNED